MISTNITVFAIAAVGVVSFIAMIFVPLYLVIRDEFFRRRVTEPLKISPINRITEICGRIAVISVIALLLAQFCVVLLRYFFSTGSIELQESAVYFHACIFMLGAGVTLWQDQHVRLDVIYAKLSRRAKAIVNLVGTFLLLLPFCITVAVTSFDYVGRSWASKESSIEVSGLNYVYLLKTVILIFAALLFLQALRWIVAALNSLRHGEKNTHEQKPEQQVR